MTGKELIPLKQVLAEMQTTNEPFPVRFVKLNEGKKQGGEIVEYPSMLLSGRKGKSEGSAAVVERKGAPVAEASSEMNEPGQITRDPNHSDNMTRNLVNTRNNLYAKVHIYLILEFNGKKVVI